MVEHPSIFMWVFKMKVCDVCGKKDATYTLKFDSNSKGRYVAYDLCIDCMKELERWFALMKKVEA